MRKLTINFAVKKQSSAAFAAAIAALLVFAVFLTWQNVTTYLDNSHRRAVLEERAERLERALPAPLANAAVRVDRGALLADIEFVNDYALRKSFSWTELLTRFEEGLPNDVQLVSVVPEFKGGKVNFAGYTRSMASALSTVDRLGKAGFEDVFLLRHTMDEKSGLILFDIAAVYRASHDE